MTESRAFLLRFVLIWVLLESLAATQVRGPEGSPILWSWLRGIVYPAIWTAERVGDLTSDVIVGLGDAQELLTENHRLRIELEDAQARNLLLTEDTESLREAAELLGLIAGFEETALAGRCVYRNLSLGRMEVRIEPPAMVPTDTPVLSAGGLAGRVVHTGHSSCWVEIVTHPAAAVAVQTLDAQVQGLVTGTGRRDLRVEYIPRTAELVRGDLLVTSGADGIYPPGIPVADVSRIRESDAAFLEVFATPRADLGAIRVVLLLPDWIPNQGRSILP